MRLREAYVWVSIPRFLHAMNDRSEARASGNLHNNKYVHLDTTVSLLSLSWGGGFPAMPFIWVSQMNWGNVALKNFERVIYVTFLRNWIVCRCQGERGNVRAPSLPSFLPSPTHPPLSLSPLCGGAQLAFYTVVWNEDWLLRLRSPEQLKDILCQNSVINANKKGMPNQKGYLNSIFNQKPYILGCNLENYCNILAKNHGSHATSYYFL